MTLLLIALLTAGPASPADGIAITYYQDPPYLFEFEGVERAVHFDPADFGLTYPFRIESLRTGFYDQMGSFTDSVFVYRIYAGDGVTELFESESLMVSRANLWHEYRLPTPVVIDSGTFYFSLASRRVSPWSYPYINTGNEGPVIHSFYGTPGAWTVSSAGEYQMMVVVDTGPVGDVGCTRILMPLGTIDSGQSVAPACSVYNFGGSTASYQVRMKVGGFYNQTAAVSNHAPGTGQLVNFPANADWLRGTHIVTCSTELAGDVQHNNDRQTDSVHVNVHDVGCVLILAPRGAVDSGQSVVPACSVYNYGTTSEDYTVRMHIGGFYDQTATVNNQAPGTAQFVSFPAYADWLRGAHAVTCSTRLNGDIVNPNDKQTDSLFVTVHDVGCIAIVAPSGAFDSGQTVTPACSVANFGNASETYTVRMKIGAGYDVQASVNAQPPGATSYVTFLPDWTASERGLNAVTCSTELAGDMQPGNDKLTSSVNVDVRDVGCVQILAPGGTLDSGQVVTPACSLYNFGTRAETYPVRVKIGGAYDTVAQVTAHAPGTACYLAFAPDWIAAPRGVQTVTCSTELAGDMRPDNDKLTDTVRVGIHDVGVTAIVAPVGDRDSGSAVTPQAQVRNFGSSDETFDIEFRIDDGYQQTITKTVTAGAESTFSFPAWTPLLRGGHAVQCSTRLAIDAVPENDRQTGTVNVRAHDVGALAILQPTGTVDSGAAGIVPRATVRNFGNSDETFDIEFRIDGGYAQTITGAARAGMDSSFDFPVWTPSSRGTRMVQCSTRLAIDGNPANDKVRDSVVVVVHDLAAQAVVSPAGTIPPGNVTPQARIRNLGTVREPVQVSFLINSAPPYAQTIVLAAGAPIGLDTAIDFPAWLASAGSFRARCSTYLATDQVPENDTVGLAFQVSLGGILDVGVEQIEQPAGVTESSFSIIPTARVKNYGSLTTGFQSFFTIHNEVGSSVFRDSVAVSSLAPGDTAQLAFSVWLRPHPPGEYTTRCSTFLTGDSVAANDTLSGSFSVVVLPPPGPGWTRLRDLPPGVKMKNVRDGGGLAYLRLDTGYVYALKGNNTAEFYRQNLANNNWSLREPVPEYGSSGRHKTVRKGAVLAAAGNGKLYATKGNNSREWWEYSPFSSEYNWVQKADVPSGKKTVRYGAGAVAVHADGADYVYFLKSSGTTEFYRYSIAADTWETLASPPLGASGRAFKAGSGLAFDSTSMTIYALKGATNEFYSYNVLGREWSTMTPLPTVYPGRTRLTRARAGAGLAFGNRRIYALKGGNCNEFWSYRTDLAVWLPETDMPAVPGSFKWVKAGGALVFAPDDDRFYAFRGNNTREFWMYIPSGADGLRLTANGRPEDAQGQSAVRSPQFALSISPNPCSQFAVRSSHFAVSYSLPVAGYVSLKLFDISGKLVSTLVSGYHPAGSYSSQLTANSSQQKLAAGIYILRLDSEGNTTTQKLVIE
jgi:hypothetical protein